MRAHAVRILPMFGRIAAMADNTGNYLIEAKGISKIFGGTKVLDNVSLTLAPGEIHSLCGENGAGKSTLIKILSGAYKPEEGVVTISRKQYPHLTPLIAKELGVEVIHQEIILVPQLSVAENIYTDIRYRTAGFFSMKKTCAAAEKLMGELGIRLNPYEPVEKLSAADQQFVKILKALAPNPRVLIMDEPTAMFNMKDTDMVLKLVKDISKKGIGIIYISHHLKEVAKIADTVSVLRDGKLVSTYRAAEGKIDMEKVTCDMVGRPVDVFFQREKSQTGEVLFEVKGLRRRESDMPIDLQLRRGEILGLTGMVGSGRTEILRAIYGLDKRFSGDIIKDGKKIEVRDPGDSIAHGIGFISEDRQKSGLVLPLDILKNITFLKLPLRRGFLSTKAEMEIAGEMIEKLDIKTDSMFKATGMLSGGNQQKVIIGKWLHKGFDILFLDEPTKGIDVNAKFEIYKLLHSLTAEGKSLIIVSSDMPEVISLCDRVLVVREDRVVGEFGGDEITEENVIKSALEVN